MNIGGVFLGFLDALLVCALIILVAFAIVWAFKWVFEKDIDPNVMKWGKVVVGLLCIIVLLTWLFGALGILGGTGYWQPRIFR